MAGFGGSVKLEGESEYRKALQQITQSLKVVSAEMKATSSAYVAGDIAQEDAVKSGEQFAKSLSDQKTALNALKTQLATMTAEYQKQGQAHQDLVKKYDSEKAKLDEIGRTLGTSSQEYKDQEKVVTGLSQEVSKSQKAYDSQGKAINDMRIKTAQAETTINQTAFSVGDLGNEIEETQKKTKKSEKEFASFGETMGKIGKVVAGAIAGIATASVAMGKAVWSMANDVASAGDEIDKESQKLGITAENYQALSYAMERSGSSIGDVSKGVKTITNDLADMERGVASAGDKYAQLGVSLKNADGTMKSTEQVMLESIDALAKMENETQRNAMAQDIFGRSASELNPLLNSGADGIKELMQEAKDYGMVMSDDAVKASANFEDSLVRLQGTMKGVKNNLMGELLPSLSMVVDGLSDLMAGNEGASESIKNGVSGMVESFSAMLPAVMELISTIAQAVLESAPTIIQSLATGILQALPQIAEVAVGLVGQLTTALSELLPDLILAGVQMIVSLMDGIAEALPDLIAMLPQIITDIIEIINEWMPDIVIAGMDILKALIDGLVQALPQLIEALPNIINSIVTTLLDMLPFIIETGVDLLIALIEGILQAIPQLIEAMPEIITNIINTLLGMLPMIIQCGIKLLVALIQNMPAIINGIVKALPTLIQGLINGLMNNLPAIINAGVQLLVALVQNLPAIISGIIKALPQIIKALIQGIASAIPQMAKAGLDLIKGLWQGISNATEWIWSKIKGFMSNVVGKIKNFFGIHSPSTLFEDEIGANLALGLGEGFSDEMKAVSQEMQDAIPTSFDTTANLNSASLAGATSGNSFDDMVSAFKDALSQMKIELDDEVAGNFVDKTVTRLIYA